MIEESALAGLQHSFPETLRAQGQAILAQGSVIITELDDEHAEATLLGKSFAHVGVEVDEHDIRVCCDCAEFRRASRCAHVWATFLALARKDGFEGALRKFPESGPQGRGKTGVPWRNAVRIVREHEGPRPVPSQENAIVYLADPLEARATGRLTLRLAVRTRRKAGGWGAPRPFRATRSSVERLPDPRDRRALGLLLGAEDDIYSYGRYEEGSDSFNLTGGQPDLLIPELCRTGRFFLWDSHRGEVPPAPCAWDEGAPWTLRLALEPDPAGDAYRLWGRLERDGRTLDLSEPLLLIDGNVVFFPDKAARFAMEAGYGWIPTLRNHGPVKVPARELPVFLDELCRTPGGGAGIELPEAVRPETVAVAPRPHLQLKAPKRSAPAARLEARLAFDYGDTRVDAGDRRSRLYLPDKNRLVLRDAAAEREARALLDQLRFFAPAYLPDALELDPKRLPRVVPALVERGWQVEGESGLFRAPGRFKMSVTSGIDWFDLEGGVQYGDTLVPFPALLAALRSGERFVRLDDGTMGLLPEDWLKRRGLVLEAGRPDGDALRFKPGQALLLDALLEAEKDAHADASFERLRVRLRSFERIEPRDAPKGFKGKLRPYQQLGLGWLEFLESSGLGGCLADDMGLGKTVQVLAWLEARRARRTAPVLVVVPKSLLWNWKAEAARFAPSLKVLEHVGLERQTAAIADADLVLTTYGTLRRDAPQLKDIRFDAAILDEAQAIKNALSATAKAARLLKADHRLALSGTPIENHLGELWSLLEFLNPGMLGKISAFRQAIESGNEPDDPTRALLARALRPVLLRRTKQQVAPELPERTEQTVPVELEPDERKRYDELKEHYRAALLGASSADFDRRKMHVLEALLRLRQAACHPGLIDPDRRGEPSAKVDTLLAQVKEVIEEGHKALVFSQFTSLLAIVRERLDRHGIVHEYLDGQTRDREARVKRFQEDAACPLFLISLKAGGVGLNLTAAEYCFLLDPWWNPAVEAQAIDRTHRIGQTRPVFAYRLVARDTVEEKVLELQKSKRALADAILGADKSLLAELTREDLALLLS